MFGLTYFRRRRLRKKAFPQSWEGILVREWPLWNRLSASRREKLKGDIHIFMEEKNFEGCGGLQVTDEMKVMVAAQASLLLLGDVSEYYPLLRSILIYPGKYRARVNDILPAGVVREGVEWRSGESWSVGTIVLAWDEVRRGMMTGNDGENLVLHEFAHQIDEENRITEQTESWLDFGREPEFDWIRDFAREWERFLDHIRRRKPIIFDTYGAQNPAEFFAVTTEVYFEQPDLCRRQAPEVYRLLKELYGFEI